MSQSLLLFELIPGELSTQRILDGTHREREGKQKQMGLTQPH